jgi:alkylated DNA repair dioxygenase AlkB
VTGPDIAWQPSLLDGGAIGFDDTFGRLQRRVLTDGAWVDHRPGWCHGSDELFARLLTETPWRGRTVHRYDQAVVALVSLGATRPFRLRPTGGGPSVLYRPGPGDLLVMGGSCQRTWQHSVPEMPGRRAADQRAVPPRLRLKPGAEWPGAQRRH